MPAGEALAVDRLALRARWSRRGSRCHPRRPHRAARGRRAARRAPVIVATGPLDRRPARRAQLRRAVRRPLLLLRRHRAHRRRRDRSTGTIAFRGSRWGATAPERTTAATTSTARSTRDAVPAPSSTAGARRAARCRRTRFEEPRYFEGCLPIEVMAERGDDVLRLRADEAGRPRDPRTGSARTRWCSCAPENRYATAYNLVGFQTRLTYPEQKRIFAHDPGAGRAPSSCASARSTATRTSSRRACSAPSSSCAARPHVRLAGQITGVEGYIESTAMGLRRRAASRTAALAGQPVAPPPPTDGARRALPPRHAAARAAASRSSRRTSTSACCRRSPAARPSAIAAACTRSAPSRRFGAWVG